MLTLLTRVLAAWKHALLAVVIITTAVAAMVLIRPRKYLAHAVVATSGPNRSMGALSDLAALSGVARGGELTNTSDMAAALLTSHRVMQTVAGLPRLRASFPQESLLKREERIRRFVEVGVDRKTGLVTVDVVVPDSALARYIAAALIDSTSAVFLTLNHDQAAAQKSGQDARIEAMGDALRTAERNLLSFNLGNRVTGPYTTATNDRQQRERAVQIAQTAYMEAVSAREAAFARELENAPAFVIIDPVPADLPPVPRYAAFFSLSAMFVAVVLVFLVVAMRLVIEKWVRGDAASERLLASTVLSLPLVGRLLRPDGYHVGG